MVDETTVYEYGSRGELISVVLPDATVIEYDVDGFLTAKEVDLDGTTNKLYVIEGEVRGPGAMGNYCAGYAAACSNNPDLALVGMYLGGIGYALTDFSRQGGLLDADSRPDILAGFQKGIKDWGWPDNRPPMPDFTDPWLYL